MQYFDRYTPSRRGGMRSGRAQVTGRNAITREEKFKTKEVSHDNRKFEFKFFGFKVFVFR
jgi:hypothetical protein